MASLHARGERPALCAMFIVTTDRCPQILCRLLGLIAQQNRLIDYVEAVDTRRILRVTLFVTDIDAERAAIIAEKMRQLVSVRTVKFHKVARSELRIAYIRHQP